MAVDAILLLSVLVSLLVYVYTKQQVPSLIPTWAELFHCLLSCIVYLRGAFRVPTYNGTLIHILTVYSNILLPPLNEQWPQC